MKKYLIEQKDIASNNGKCLMQFYSLDPETIRVSVKYKNSCMTEFNYIYLTFMNFFPNLLLPIPEQSSHEWYTVVY